MDTGVELKEPQRSVQIYFDPASKLAFRSAMKNGIDRLIARIESHTTEFRVITKSKNT